MTRHLQTTLPLQTCGQGFYAFGSSIDRWLDEIQSGPGIVTVFCRHTSASLTIQENADSDVLKDLSEFFERLIPNDSEWIRHKMEGSDDMPAHIRTALTDTTLSIPCHERGLLLGTWQEIYLIEHRTIPHTRTVILHYCGE